MPAGICSTSVASAAGRGRASITHTHTYVCANCADCGEDRGHDYMKYNNILNKIILYMTDYMKYDGITIRKNIYKTITEITIY